MIKETKMSQPDLEKSIIQINLVHHEQTAILTEDVQGIGVGEMQLQFYSSNQKQ
uniref:Uncharacterized protein n=1 Tax=Anguilla anguilla TaxID=7936 RepID=A0A0E9RVT2_ANGAN